MNDLADGFARHLADWAASLGAPADSRALLDTVARRLAIATSAGHVCVPLEAFVGARSSPGDVPPLPDEEPPDWDQAVFADDDVASGYDALARVRERPTASAHPSGDDLVGAKQDRLGQCNFERSRRSQIDCQLELRRLLERNIRGPRAFQNFRYLARRATEPVQYTGAIRDQSACLGVVGASVDSGQAGPGNRRNDARSI